MRESKLLFQAGVLSGLGIVMEKVGGPLQPGAEVECVGMDSGVDLGH